MWRPTSLADAALVALPNFASATLVYAMGTDGPACPPAPLQPPGYVFAVAWTVLYTLLGIALASTRSTTAHVHVWALMVALDAWWLVFSQRCRPVAALTTIVAITGYTCWIVARLRVRVLAPLLAWLVFACVLSAQILLLGRAHDVTDVRST